jgi:hypothetical protein
VHRLSANLVCAGACAALACSSPFLPTAAAAGGPDTSPAGLTGATLAGLTLAGSTLAGSTLAGSTNAGSTNAARPATATGQSSSSEGPIPVPASRVPPTGRRLSADQVLAIANALPKMRAVRARYPGSYGGAYLKPPFNWQVSYFSRDGKKEIGQVIIADSSGRVLEQWTGFQVAWTMARGYPGAFGRHVNALFVWLPLCVLFILPFFNFRRPFSLLHLDLLVLLSFSVSLAFFNHGRIYASVPLAYPPLLYLLVRMLLLARPGRIAEESSDPGLQAAEIPAGEPQLRTGFDPAVARAQPAFAVRREPALGAPPAPGGPNARPPTPARRPREAVVRLLVPAPWLALGLVFLIGFRVALNVTDSNVIDVGYAGVIGAQRIVDGKPLYGSYPSDNERGDTYGPATYEAYVPFEQLFGWSGTWDELPASHAAAVVFDLLAVGLLFLLGRRLRGPTMGIALAYAWVSYPFTLFALESNSNDTLVAVLLLAALLFATSAPARGVCAALASLTKFAPLLLAPLLSTHGLWSGGSNPRAADSSADPRWRIRAFAVFWVAFALTAAVVAIPALSHDSLHTIYERTIAYQANRGSPFSVWGLYGGLRGVESGVEIGAVALALLLAVVPRRPDLVGLAAACAAVLVAIQLGLEHWFYLYIPWFFPLVMVALFCRLRITAPRSESDAREALATGVVRSSRPAVVVSSGSGLR